MQILSLYISRIGGIDPTDTSVDPPRNVTLTAHYETERGHHAAHDFEFWIPANLTDLATIEREAYRQLREHLTVLASRLQGDRT